VAPYGNPWELLVPNRLRYQPRRYTETYHDEVGRFRVRWVPGRLVKGVAYDTLSWATGLNTTTSCACEGEAAESFASMLNWATTRGRGRKDQIQTYQVLYPTTNPTGKGIRLAQQYFFVSCSLKDMIRIHLLSGNSWTPSPARGRCSSTTPIPPLPWRSSCGCSWTSTSWSGSGLGTSHGTLAPIPTTPFFRRPWKSAAAAFQHVLPRHLEIIYEINRRFLTSPVRFRGTTSGTALLLSTRPARSTCVWRI